MFVSYIIMYFFVNKEENVKIILKRVGKLNKIIEFRIDLLVK